MKTEKRSTESSLRKMMGKNNVAGLNFLLGIVYMLIASFLFALGTLVFLEVLGVLYGCLGVVAPLTTSDFLSHFFTHVGHYTPLLLRYLTLSFLVVLMGVGLLGGWSRFFSPKHNTKG